MNILLAHFRVGETDGVSLEMDKWKWALEALGHKVYYLAGSAGNCEAEIISELHYLDSFNDKILHNAYIERCDFDSESVLIQAIEARAEAIANGIIEIIQKHHIDIVVPNNMWSLGYHLPAAIGLFKAIEATQTRVICHHHDFYWERVKYANPTSGGIENLLNTYFPPKHSLITHCVINRIAQIELKKRRDIESVVVPNVFDFHGSNWQIDDYNRDLRDRFGIKPHDVIFLQATRIVARKGIELAVDLIDQVAKRRNQLVGKVMWNGNKFEEGSRLILMFAGMCEEERYLDHIRQKAKQKSVDLLFINDWVSHSRAKKEGKKVYSLWDVYSHADIITYPSLLEGWGNQFLEGLVAKLPMVVYRYPVYNLDIADYEFDIIDLGNHHDIDENGLVIIPEKNLTFAAEKTIEYLLNGDKRSQQMDRNYQIGKNSLSYHSLQHILSRVFGG